MRRQIGDLSRWFAFQPFYVIGGNYKEIFHVGRQVRCGGRRGGDIQNFGVGSAAGDPILQAIACDIRLGVCLPGKRDALRCVNSNGNQQGEACGQNVAKAGGKHVLWCL